MRASLDDLEHIKAICNHHSIRRHWDDPYAEVDPTRWLADPRNVILFDGMNAGIFLWRWIGIYEVHCLFTAKGNDAIELGRGMIGAMFSAGAGMLLTVIPDTHGMRHVRWFARRMGFASRGHIQTIEGPSEMLQLEASQWVS